MDDSITNHIIWSLNIKQQMRLIVITVPKSILISYIRSES
jgi:hypothetical protein